MGKGSFIFYESFLEAMEEMDGDTAKETLFAIARYALAGEEPADLRGWAKSVFVMARPQIDKNADRYEKSLGGGRPQAELPPQEDLEAMRQELGSWDAVAVGLGVNKATLFRRRQAARPQNESQKPQNGSQIAKPNVHDNVHENVNVHEQEEREGELRSPVEQQAAPALLCSVSLSQSSALPPTEMAAGSPQSAKPPKAACKHKPAAFAPPSAEDVAAFCKERKNAVDAEAFVAFYASKGWMVGKNKMRDWRQAVITWEKRSREGAGEGRSRARASPAPVSVQREQSGWHSVRTVLAPVGAEEEKHGQN